MKFKHQLIKEIKKINKIAKNNNKLTGFIIGNTSKIEKSDEYFFTPLRTTEKMVYSGLIVFSEKFARLASKYIDGKINYILVDAEKKIPPKKNGKPSNIERRVKEILKKSKLWFFKGNDLTVDAVDILLTFLMKNDLRGIGGKKIAIIGAGNIGTKIALLMVERGAKVFITRKNYKKLKNITNTLNSIKPIYTREKIIPVKNNLAAMSSADIIIGTTNGKAVIDKTVLSKVKSKPIIVDVGKGTVFKDALIYAIRKKINIYRVDISAALNGFINKSLMIEKMKLEKLGRKKILGETLVAGGLLGAFEEIIVDNTSKPNLVYGMSDGNGDFLRKLNSSQIVRLEKIKKYFKIKE
tara:strand:- start:1242 stop:2300 length:1059 start_codon:yes stop_codon:yes gene_type:complete